MIEDWLSQLKGQWLTEVEAGRMSATELAERILQHEYPGSQAYHPDADRRRRCAFGEVIFGQGKPAEMIVTIAHQLLKRGPGDHRNDSDQTQPNEREVLVTRVDVEVARIVAVNFEWSRYDMLGRTLRLSNSAPPDTSHTDHPMIAVVCAGSTDLPVAREALETLAWMRVPATSLVDVGVAGPYRLLPHLGRLRACKAIVVIAGMEGALASVVGGLVGCPVIAVPTSVGYGANLAGVTTLLSMLSSCAAGVTVVNIDAGFKGGYIAGLIAHQHQVSPALETHSSVAQASVAQASVSRSSKAD